jgi:hypothetical protein
MPRAKFAKEAGGAGGKGSHRGTEAQRHSLAEAQNAEGRREKSGMEKPEKGTFFTALNFVHFFVLPTSPPAYA